MNQELIDLHLAAGKYYGEQSTCGSKQKFYNESDAIKAASSLNKSPKRHHFVEAYPCYFCSSESGESEGLYTWHIGREMGLLELQAAAKLADEGVVTEVVELNTTDPIFGVNLGIAPLRVHSKSVCAGSFCSVHNPSNHHMVAWPLNWRADRRIMERMCPHGTGHPDPDDADYRKTLGDNDVSHGCDGCCYEKVYYGLAERKIENETYGRNNT